MTPSAPRISEDELARLEELAGKATPGPWKSRVGYGPDGFEPEGYRFVQFGPTEAKAKGLGTDQLRPADADLIAEAVNALPRLIATARSAPAAGLREALVEAVMPLEVIAGQDRVKPYRELSRDFIETINHAIDIVRAALAAEEVR